MGKPDAEFRSVEFEKVDSSTRLKPRILVDRVSGHIRGDLVSLHTAGDAILIGMNFHPWKPGQPDIDEIRASGLFLLVKKGGQYLGRIVEANGISRGYDSGGEFFHLGNVGKSGGGFPGRDRASFLLKAWGEYPVNQVSLSVFLRRKLFGGWKDLVIDEPEGKLVLARP